MTENKKNGCLEWLKFGVIGVLALFGFLIASSLLDFVQSVISALIGPALTLFLIGSAIMFLLGNGDK